MIKLSDYPTRAPEGFTKDETKARTYVLAKRIGELQRVMYAQNKHSMLVVFQGMDASGKDGATRKVFRFASPSYVSAQAFKRPTEEELSHDFLWRIHRHVPPKGQIQVFNRSHYEDVIVQRVHNWIDDDTFHDRMRAINAFERNLVKDNNTTILKFYMHLSKKRQKEKLIERIEDKTKNWKHNDGDWKERKHWDEYMKCYEDVFEYSDIPWIIAPVDQRWYRDYFIASRILETLESLDLQLPELNIKRPKDD